ncbi:MAG: cyd operon YbgE family protein [Gammaproteobacteria bacterium]|nr:cyd operon YbgE family protein [Gammaproteobacteria bacterium]MCW8839721.1 cyd operon YbgE family protein [Gammaproteobacteria bacterium]MCW8959082.1 cyd operon YbgE family protein [Gammaproteobacteria bacterium]MCW8994161.1 cyd operon YbgE family protein [Gammaproteobacteria bacterium]
MASPRRKHGEALNRIPYPSAGWVRLISITLTAGLVWIFFSRPGDVVALLDQHGDGIMAPLLWGVAIGLVHGTGFMPYHAVWRLLFNPFIGWPLLLYGIVMALAH